MACSDSAGMHADFAVIECNITADCESFSCTITFLSNAVHTICSLHLIYVTHLRWHLRALHRLAFIFFNVFIRRNVLLFFVCVCACVTVIVRRRHHHFQVVGAFCSLHVNLNLSSEYKMNINIV